jgi:hypothetical protein
VIPPIEWYVSDCLRSQIGWYGDWITRKPLFANWELVESTTYRLTQGYWMIRSVAPYRLTDGECDYPRLLWGTEFTECYTCKIGYVNESQLLQLWVPKIGYGGWKDSELPYIHPVPTEE